MLFPLAWVGGVARRVTAGPGPRGPAGERHLVAVRARLLRAPSEMTVVRGSIFAHPAVPAHGVAAATADVPLHPNL